MKPFRIGLTMSQDKPWETQLAEWRLVESLGFDTICLVDHFMPVRGSLDEPFLEGWTLLAALGALVPRVRVAIIVSGNTYRNPALLAKQAATVDHITGGRLDLGIGAGWVEHEHIAYGFRFPTPGERVDMLREACIVIRSLMAGGRANFTGQHYQLVDAPFQPPPVQPGGIPLMVAGEGDRMLKLTAEFADIWNLNNSPERFAERGARLNHYCAIVGRDPESIRWSAFSFPLVVDRDAFGSVENFRYLALRYIAAGADEIQFRFPEDERGVETLHAVPSVFDELRAAHAERTMRPGL